MSERARDVLQRPVFVFCQEGWECSEEELLEKENNQSIMADVMPREHPRLIVIVSSLRYLG